MLDSKFLFTLIGLIVAVFAICKTNMSPAINEGFWGNSGAPRTVKVMREVHRKGCNPYSSQNNYQTMLGNEKFVSRPSLQGTLSPRFSNVDYGAHIRYNMPSYKNQGAPCSPLDMGNMVKESFQEDYSCANDSCGGGCGVANCGKGGVPPGLPGSGIGSISEDPNYVNQMNSIYKSHGAPPGVNSLAVGDMTTIGADTNVTQPIVYDRYIYANQKSRLRSLGDPIRGDLAIVPCNNGWFNPSVNPHIDLHEGAMNVLGGVSNSTANSVSELRFSSSGGLESISGGVNMANEFSTTLGAGMTDVNVTAFP